MSMRRFVLAGPRLVALATVLAGCTPDARLDVVKGSVRVGPRMGVAALRVDLPSWLDATVRP
ncbi:MAG: hypothetical protein FJ104_16755 [Deltaproteobacteria bacterium]|nr:hypothetical protein [Deltaproteobacteria bacterium]